MEMRGDERCDWIREEDIEGGGWHQVRTAERLNYMRQGRPDETQPRLPEEREDNRRKTREERQSDISDIKQDRIDAELNKIG